MRRPERDTGPDLETTLDAINVTLQGFLKRRWRDLDPDDVRVLEMVASLAGIAAELNRADEAGREKVPAP